MGTYVAVVEQEFMLKKEHYEAAYKALCDLNNRNELKSGGSSNRDKSITEKNDGVWFSWMDWDYDEKCKDLFQILEQVGFDIGESDIGITSLYYDSKMGDEEYFLEALAPFVEDGSYIIFRSENDDVWKYEFDSGSMITLNGTISYDFS